MPLRVPFLKIMNYEEFDRMPVIHWTGWNETNRRWQKEAGIKPEEQVEFFQAESLHEGSMIPVNVDLFPLFEEKIIEETKEYRIIRQGDGVICKDWKGKSSIPHYIDYILKDRTGWEEYKKRLKFWEDRLPKNWNELIETYQSTDKVLILSCGSMMGWIRNWMGMENLSIAMFEDPDFVREVVDTISDMACELAERVLQDVRVDMGWFWEDICFKNGPLISPKMFRQFAGPGYKKITTLLNKHGINLIAVDCDGLIDDLVPIWLENGVNVMFPVEIGTWNADPMEFRKRHGKELRIIGGIDKMVLEKTPRDIDEEIEKRIPLMREGGFVPLPDHLITPGVSIKNYKYYLERIRSLRF